MKNSSGINSPQRIVFLVPGDQSGLCGVTDYSLWLARAAAEQGHQILVLSIYPFSQRPFMADIATSTAGKITTRPPTKSPASVEEIAQALASFKPDLVILQFSTPVFRTGKLVYPYLARICRVLRTFKVFLMVHETWISSDTRRSIRNYLLQKFRRFEILAAWRSLHPQRVYASNSSHLGQLTSAGLAPHHLPIFSNIPPTPRPPHHRAALHELLETRGASDFLPDSPYITIFFGRIAPSWDPSPVMARLQREAHDGTRTLCVISIGETGYSDQGWQRVVKTAEATPTLRLGKSSPTEIITLLHAADCGITPNALDFWLKSGTCAAMVGCELPIVFSQTDIPPDIPLPPRFATLGQHRLDWHQPTENRVIQISTPKKIWQCLQEDIFTSTDSKHAPPIIFHGVTLLEGTGGLNQYAFAALTALRSDAKQPAIEVWIPSALRHHPKIAQLGPVHLYAAPHPRRGFAFNHLFWVNCLSLHLRLRRPRSPVFSPIEVYSLLPLRNLLVTAHDCYADRFGSPYHPGRTSLGRRLSIGQLKRSRILSVSRFTTNELHAIHRIPLSQINTVHNWLPLNYSLNPPAAELAQLKTQLNLPDRFWLYIGGFRLNKHLPFLFEAYAATRAANPNTPPLVIAGNYPKADTPFTGPFHEAIDRHPGLRPHLYFPGFIPDDKLSALYKLAELVICPSAYEGFGYPVIEATSVGTPVIAARATSFNELGLPPGNLFSIDDPRELITMLGQAADGLASRFHSPCPPRFSTSEGENRFRDAISQWLRPTPPAHD